MVSLGLFILRLIVGFIMMAHGATKLFGGEGKGEALPERTKQVMGEKFVASMESGGIGTFSGALESMNVPDAKKMAWLVALLEGGGGLALMLGWQTRPVAAAMAVSQIVAINKAHVQDGFYGGYEYNASLIAATGALALTGPGKIAVD